MKNYSIILLLFFNSITANAQDSLIYTCIDSALATNNASMILFVESLVPAAKTKDEYQAIQKALIKLYINNNRIVPCLELCRKNILLAQANKNTQDEAEYTKLLGNTYYAMPLKDKAIEYWQKCIDLCKKNNKKNTTLQEICLHNIGSVYCEMEQNSKAEEYLLASIALCKQNGLSISENNNRHQRVLATLYERMNQLDKAENLYQQILQNSKILKDTVNSIGALLFYSKIFLKKNNIVQACKMSAEALSLTRLMKVNDMTSAALEIHIANLLANKEFEKACVYFKEIDTMTRAVFKTDMNKKIGEEEVRFNTNQIKHEKEVAILKAKKEKQIYAFLFISILGIASFAAYFYLQKKKQKQIKEIQKERLQSIIDGEEKERTRIAKDLHDGIVQDLTAIKIQLKSAIQSNGTITESIVHDATISIDKASKEVRNISYQMMPATLRELGFIPAIDDLLKRVLTASNVEYEFEQIGLTDRLPEKIEVSIFRIIQELLNNVLKHSEANFVSLLITQKEKVITMIFEDNGKGFDELTVKRGIGLNSLSSRVELLQGNIKYENVMNSGVLAIIKIPLFNE
jgi:signal transduction histidine kinase